MRRIGYLLEEIRLHGENKELVEEIKKLGIKYGIVTPYTSFLVTEEERQTLNLAAPEVEEAFFARKVTGAGAVKMAKGTKELMSIAQVPQFIYQKIKYKEDKTFYLKDGYWIDTDYKEGSPVKEIRFNSDEYFRLLAEKPGLAKYLSIAVKVIVNYKGVNYKIVTE